MVAPVTTSCGRNFPEVVTMWQRLVREQEADDLIEYALLATVVGVAGGLALAAWPGIMMNVYESWDTGTQDIWEPLDPQ